MSHVHSLGPLRTDDLVVEQYRLGQQAMGAALRAVLGGRCGGTAVTSLFVVAAHIADTIAARTAPLDPERAARWRAVARARRAWGHELAARQAAPVAV